MTYAEGRRPEAFDQRAVAHAADPRIAMGGNCVDAPEQLLESADLSAQLLPARLDQGRQVAVGRNAVAQDPPCERLVVEPDLSALCPYGGDHVGIGRAPPEVPGRRDAELALDAGELERGDRSLVDVVAQDEHPASVADPLLVEEPPQRHDRVTLADYDAQEAAVLGVASA